jgi:hypothetical protein
MHRPTGCSTPSTAPRTSPAAYHSTATPWPWFTTNTPCSQSSLCRSRSALLDGRRPRGVAQPPADHSGAHRDPLRGDRVPRGLRHRRPLTEPGRTGPTRPPRTARPTRTNARLRRHGPSPSAGSCPLFMTTPSMVVGQGAPGADTAGGAVMAVTDTVRAVVRGRAWLAVVLVFHCLPSRPCTWSPCLSRIWVAPRAGAGRSLKQRAVRGMGARPVGRSAREAQER